MPRLYLLPSIFEEETVPDNFPNFDIIVHEDDETWFQEALKHLEEDN